MRGSLGVSTISATFTILMLLYAFTCDRTVHVGHRLLCTCRSPFIRDAGLLDKLRLSLVTAGWCTCPLKPQATPPVGWRPQHERLPHFGERTSSFRGEQGDAFAHVPWRSRSSGSTPISVLSFDILYRGLARRSAGSQNFISFHC